MQLPSAARVTGLCANRKGSQLLLTCHDRTCRLYDVLQPPGQVWAAAAHLASGCALAAGAAAAASSAPHECLLGLEAARSVLRGVNIKVGALGIPHRIGPWVVPCNAAGLCATF
jgi:hypothetical protein